MYTPSKPPAVSSQDAQALASYLNDELQVLASSLLVQDPIQMVVSNKAPSRPRTGLIVYADGVNWNPGSGEGAYSFGSDGNWHFLDYILPAPQVCRISLVTTNQTVSSANTFTKIAFNGVDFDPNSIFDSTNHRIKPTVAGYYQVNWGAEFQSTSGVVLYIASLFKNGAEQSRGNFVNVSVSVVAMSTGADIVHMNGTTDYFEVDVFLQSNTSGVGMLVLAGSALSFLSISLVRPG